MKLLRHSLVLFLLILSSAIHAKTIRGGIIPRQGVLALHTGKLPLEMGYSANCVIINKTKYPRPLRFSVFNTENDIEWGGGLRLNGKKIINNEQDLLPGKNVYDVPTRPGPIDGYLVFQDLINEYNGSPDSVDQIEVTYCNIL